MAERIILDPTEESTGRTQFDVTAWIANAGPDWGEGAISAYTAELARGASVIDFRVPNRTVEIPLILQARGGTSFATARALVQAKASLFQREGGKIRRTTTAGSTVYADVVNATLKLGGGWLQSAKDADLDATLSLECLPDFYEAEVTLSDHTETSLSELVFTETTVRGDYPARVRVVVDEDQAQSQLGLIWSFRNRHYSSASTAATRFEAESLNLLDAAIRSSLGGASGGTVVTHTEMSTNWTPIMDMRAGGTAYPTHTGTNRLWVRYRTTSGTAAHVRAVWDVGDMVFPVENAPVRCQGGGTQYYMADLGEVRLDPSPTGTHRWNAIIQGRGDYGHENLSIDKVWVVNADEGYGVLTAPFSTDPGLQAFSARDEFNQSAAALTTKVLPTGGTWGSASTTETDDFAVEATGHTATRGAVSDVEVRAALAGTAVYSTVAVQMDFKTSVVTSSNFGPLIRYVDPSNYLVANVNPGTGTSTLIELRRVTSTSPGTQNFTSLGSVTLGPLAADVWYSIRLFADASGKVLVWLWLWGGSSGAPIITSHSVDLATGGALDDGRVGFREWHASSTAATRNYDNFAAWVPSPNAVLNASQPAELRWDGMLRKDSTGTAYGPVSEVVGDLPRLPPTVEGRTTEVFLKQSRGNFNDLPDTGIDDISARITYRPCWLTVPGT